MHSTRPAFVALAIALPLAFAACKQEAAKPPPPPPAPAAAPAPAPKPPSAAATQPFHVSNIELGSAIGGDKRVSLAKTTFAPTDTIYASVATDGTSPNVDLVARWTYGDEGQLVKEDRLAIAPTGPATNEFHISKPDGWPAGKYKVEITANGAPVGSKEFEVASQ
jgi:hypothetical protein